MAKRSIIKKLSKEQKSLLIGLLLGDGTISSNCVFKLSHSEAQREYLEWKVGLLDVHGIKNNGVKEYIYHLVGITLVKRYCIHRCL